MKDERYQQIMAEFGMPDSLALLATLKRVVNEVTQEVQERERQQRDELLDALEQIAECDGWIGTNHEHIKRIANEAIAKARGQQSCQ